MIDQAAIEAKRQQLLEDLQKWAKDHGDVPEGYRLVVGVNIEVVPLLSVSEVDVHINYALSCAEIRRGRVVYLTRQITDDEKNELLSIDWQEPSKSVVELVISKGEAGADEIGLILTEHGAGGTKAEIGNYRERINSLLYSKDSNLRLGHSEGGHGFHGPFRFFCKKNK